MPAFQLTTRWPNGQALECNSCPVLVLGFPVLVLLTCLCVFFDHSDRFYQRESATTGNGDVLQFARFEDETASRSIMEHSTCYIMVQDSRASQNKVCKPGQVTLRDDQALLAHRASHPCDRPCHAVMFGHPHRRNLVAAFSLWVRVVHHRYGQKMSKACFPPTNHPATSLLLSVLSRSIAGRITQALLSNDERAEARGGVCRWVVSGIRQSDWATGITPGFALFHVPKQMVVETLQVPGATISWASQALACFSHTKPSVHTRQYLT